MIIFLDIDGVLVSYLELKSFYKDGSHNFKKEAVLALNALIRKTNAQIVISSTWRKLYRMDDLIEIFKVRGVEGEIIGKTKNFGARGEEIEEYIKANNIEEYIIIDDEMVDIYPTLPHNYKTHIKTNSFRCLDIYDLIHISNDFRLLIG